MAKLNDLNGKIFGRLTVIERSGSNKRGRSLWRVRCLCGKIFDVLGNSLSTGNTLSCGCLQKEKARNSIRDLHVKQWGDQKFVVLKRNEMKARFTTHGARCRSDLDPIYETWHAMISRCNSVDSYIRKGIVVCTEWRNSFVTFKEWALSNGYVKGKHLDRIDNTKNYCPSNCQFLNPKEHYKKTGNEHRKGACCYA